MSINYQLDIARNIRTIEWLKAELVSRVGFLLQAMLKDREEEITEALAGIMISSYLLGSRLGVDFGRLDKKVLGKVRANALGGHEIEKWYGDFSALLEHLREREK